MGVTVTILFVCAIVSFINLLSNFSEDFKDTLLILNILAFNIAFACEQLVLKIYGATGQNTIFYMFFFFYIIVMCFVVFFVFRNKIMDQKKHWFATCDKQMTNILIFTVAAWKIIFELLITYKFI